MSPSGSFVFNSTSEADGRRCLLSFYADRRGREENLERVAREEVFAFPALDGRSARRKRSDDDDERFFFPVFSPAVSGSKTFGIRQDSQPGERREACKGSLARERVRRARESLRRKAGSGEWECRW